MAGDWVSREHEESPKCDLRHKGSYTRRRTTKKERSRGRRLQGQGIENH